MLILQADRDSLLKPLQAVTGIVERRHTLPILSNVLLESKDGQTKLLATDLEIQINTAGRKVRQATSASPPTPKNSKISCAPCPTAPSFRSTGRTTA